MNSQLKIVVDADAIIAQANQNDFHHDTAVSISTLFSSTNAHIIYPATAIAEATSYLQRVLNNSASAYATAIVFTYLDIHVANITQKTIQNAMDYFSPKTSKKNTLFDCIVLAVAKEYEADAIFSFDRFYQKNGFKLASDL